MYAHQCCLQRRCQRQDELSNMNRMRAEGHLEFASDSSEGRPMACTGSASKAASSAGPRWLCPAPSGPQTSARACAAWPTALPPARKPPPTPGPALPRAPAVKGAQVHWSPLLASVPPSGPQAALTRAFPGRSAVAGFSSTDAETNLFPVAEQLTLKVVVVLCCAGASCWLCGGGGRRESDLQGRQRLAQLRLQARGQQWRQQPAGRVRQICLSCSGALCPFRWPSSKMKVI